MYKLLWTAYRSRGDRGKKGRDWLQKYRLLREVFFLALKKQMADLAILSEKLRI